MAKKKPLNKSKKRSTNPLLKQIAMAVYGDKKSDLKSTEEFLVQLAIVCPESKDYRNWLILNIISNISKARPLTVEQVAEAINDLSKSNDRDSWANRQLGYRRSNFEQGEQHSSFISFVSGNIKD